MYCFFSKGAKLIALALNTRIKKTYYYSFLENGEWHWLCYLHGLRAEKRPAAGANATLYVCICKTMQNTRYLTALKRVPRLERWFIQQPETFLILALVKSLLFVLSEVADEEFCCHVSLNNPQTTCMQKMSSTGLVKHVNDCNSFFLPLAVFS